MTKYRIKAWNKQSSGSELTVTKQPIQTQELAYYGIMPSKVIEINKKNPLTEINDFINSIKGIHDRYSSFEKIEDDVKRLINHLESTLLGECLQQYDIHTKIIVKNGELYRHVLREEKTYRNRSRTP